MTKRIKNKIRAVIVIMIILLWVVFCFCLLNRTGSVHYYPVLVSQTFNNELNKHKCISLDGKIYCYSDSLFKRGIYELSDNEKKFLINTEKIYSMATYNNIVAYETKDNIFFYDCASGSIRYFSEDEISKIREYLDCGNIFNEYQDSLYSDNEGIILLHGDFAVRIYPSVLLKKMKYTSCLKIGLDNENLIIQNPNSPNESIFLKRPDKKIYGGVVKPYNDKSVCLIQNRSQINLSIGHTVSRVIVADFEKKSAEYVFIAGDKQQVVYADDKKCVYYDYNEKSFFSYSYDSGESKLLKHYKLKNFMNYYIENADESTFIIYNYFYKILDVFYME